MLVAAAALAVASALRFEANDAPRVAVCVTGGTNSVPHAAIRTNLYPFVESIGGRGLSRELPDAFAYVTLQGLGKVQRAWEPGLDKERVLKRHEHFWVRYSEAEEAVVVTEESSDKYIDGRDGCFKNGQWGKDAAEMFRSVNQLVLMQSCMELISEHERTNEQRYDAVVFVKPDTFHTGARLNMTSVARDGHFVSQQEMLLAMPRSAADDLGAARPLKCSKGESCCGKVGSYGTMLEMILGVTPAGGEPCGCGPRKDKVTQMAFPTSNVDALRTVTPFAQGYLPPLPEVMPFE